MEKKLRKVLNEIETLREELNFLCAKADSIRQRAGLLQNIVGEIFACYRDDNYK